MHIVPQAFHSVAPPGVTTPRPSDDGDSWDQLAELLAFRRAMARGDWDPDDFDLLAKDPDHDGESCAYLGVR